MRAAEGGKKVIQRVLVGNIDGRNVQVRLEAAGVKEIVLADGSVEQVAGRDARRVLVVVAAAGRGNLHQIRGILRGQAGCGQGIAGGCLNAIACKSSLKLFVGGQAAQVHRGLSVERGRSSCTGAVGVV